MFKKSIYTYIILAMFVAIGLTIFILVARMGMGAGDAETVPALTVQTVSPKKVKFKRLETAYGYLQPWQEVVIGMELQGLRVQKVLVEEGDTVEQGQVLATFDTTLVQADLSNALAQVAQAKAQLQEAQLQLEAANKVGGSGAISKVQQAQYRSAAEVAAAQLKAAQAQVAKNQYWLKQTQVVAPHKGVISSRSIAVGQDLNTGSELFRLIRDERLEWQAELHPRQVALVQKSNMVSLEMETGEKVYGTVRQVSPKIDTNRRTATVFVDVAIPQPMRSQVRAGLFAKGSFQTGEKEVVVVPQSSVSWRDGFAWIMVVDSTSQTVQPIQVVLGGLQDGYYEILTPLDSQTQVVLEGSGFLNPGDKVRVEQPAVSGASSL